MMAKLAAPGDSSPKKVLVAPLDWGLGHATRCVPIIRALLALGHQVWLAGEAAVQTLLQAEFPNLPFLPLKGYRVRYGASATGTALRLLQQVPKLQRAIRYEHQWLQQQMQTHRFNCVISDNRYGLYHPQAHCVCITHQLQIKAPLGFAEPLLRRLHYRYIQKFDTCWVPDHCGEPSLAGALSHPRVMPRVPVCYIGPLSRMQQAGSHTGGGKLLFLLSGPEPQRSLLETHLLGQAIKGKITATLVRGLPGDVSALRVPGHITVHNHLTAAQLNRVLEEADLVVCRSGYSTVMDLAALGKKSILIPTPGQTEQQYLARHLQAQGLALWRNQQHFDLQKALAAAAEQKFRFNTTGATDMLYDAIQNLIPGRLAAVQQA